MEHKTLTAEERTGFGKGAAGRLRKAGQIPAVIYGHTDNLSIAIDAKEFNTKFKVITENTIIDIALDGKNHQVLVKDFQSDILSGSIDHLDFYEIEKGKSLKTHVPLKLKGNPPGVKEGGILVQKMEELEIECLPKDLPQDIIVDISKLNIHDSIHVGDLPLAEGVNVLDNKDATIVIVGLAKAATTTTDVDEEESEEVEEA